MNRRHAFLSFLLAAVFLPAAPAPAQKANAIRGETRPDATDPHGRDPKKGGPAPVSPATLHWNNGESLTGEPTGATNESLVWKSPLFDDSLELAWSALHRVDKNPADAEPADAFAFVLRDGSRVYGDLTSITPDTIGIHSTRHGDAVLRRPEVVGAWRVHGHRLVYGGPWGDSGWTPAPNVRVEQENTASPDTMNKVPTRLTGPGGSLVLPFWHRTLANTLTLPDRADVEFHLHATDQPAFQLVLDGREKKRLRIETWGNQIVLANSKGFEEICELGDKQKSVSLHVCWDRTARSCKVYAADGTLLKEWEVADASDGGKPSVFIANKGRDLTLDLLRIREWDGQPPAPTDNSQPHVELDDGRVLAGRVAALEDGALLVASPGEGPNVSEALEGVDAMIFADAPTWRNPHEATLSCADGTILSGQITGFEEGRALLKTTFTEAPLSVRIDNLCQLYVHATGPAGTSPEPPLDTMDKIVVQGTTLHGRLVASAGGDTPRWLPIGGEHPVTPAKAAASEITRVSKPGGETALPGALLYTRMGDALPGLLHGLDRKEVDFESPWLEITKLPAEELEAVQFDTVDKGAITGFNASGWQVFAGDKTDPKDLNATLKLKPNAMVGHPAAAQEGEVNFLYDTETYSCLKLRIFCDGLNSTRALKYILMRSGNRVSSGLEATEGQFNNVHQTTIPGGPVPVKLLIDEKSVRCFVNQALVETIWFPAGKRAGAGLILESSSVWGNQAQDISLSGFTANAVAGRSFLVNVNSDAKAQALSIPRFRKDDPPRHALLASNGDVLRGEIVALTNTQIGFRIGLETLHIPRERVAALIALQPPAATPTAPEQVDPVQKMLERSVGLRTWYSNVGYTSLLNIIRRSVPEFKFQAPSESNGLRVQFRFDNQSVGDVIDGICEQFSLRYHVDKGTVVFEVRDSRPDLNLVRKTFWLRTNPFEGHTAEEVFGAKDVPFPKGASAQWQEVSRCLEVTNTAANLDKIDGLLANDFGGTLGSPTHWLLLRNGGRIGLVVDKFGPDAILGTHPIYGPCKIPLAEVYAVRNTMPEPTATTRAVSGWRLVYAPEPVLPESGGENSDLLGKDAPTFKLKTLGGEDFDLAQQKGNVVVLDFWATWCGPCIKSLPGLIDAMGRFPADKVKLIGVNQAEAPDQIKRFLETHEWKLAVALDGGQSVAKQYGVDGIPHTVVVGPDGKVAWTQTGFSADGDEKAGEVVRKLLAGPGTTPSATPVPASNSTNAEAEGKPKSSE